MRIIVIGGPLCGKSTFAQKYSEEHSALHYCGDPISKVKRVTENTKYLPDHLDWSGGSDYIAKNWFNMKGPWVIEGVGIVRALRKWSQTRSEMPCDMIVYITNQHPSTTRLPGQDAMEKAIATMWDGIKHKYKNITHYQTW